MSSLMYYDIGVVGLCRFYSPIIFSLVDYMLGSSRSMADHDCQT